MGSHMKSRRALSFHALSAVAIAIGLAGCRSNDLAATTSPAVRAPASTTGTPPARVAVPENEISELARREILRRRERVARADRAALESRQRMAEGNLEGAVSGYREAVSELESSP